MPGWLVLIHGQLSDRAQGALVGADMTFSARRRRGTGRVLTYTVRVDAPGPGQAKAKVRHALPPNEASNVGDVASLSG